MSAPLTLRFVSAIELSFCPDPSRCPRSSSPCPWSSWTCGATLCSACRALDRELVTIPNAKNQVFLKGGRFRCLGLPGIFTCCTIFYIHSSFVMFSPPKNLCKLLTSRLQNITVHCANWQLWLLGDRSYHRWNDQARTGMLFNLGGAASVGESTECFGWTTFGPWLLSIADHKIKFEGHS